MLVKCWCGILTKSFFIKITPIFIASLELHIIETYWNLYFIYLLSCKNGVAAVYCSTCLTKYLFMNHMSMTYHYFMIIFGIIFSITYSFLPSTHNFHTHIFHTASYKVFIPSSGQKSLFICIDYFNKVS